jgi:hypothetical protein
MSFKKQKSKAPLRFPGGNTEFSRGKSNNLRDMTNAEKLVQEATRSVLRQYLVEPDLLADLKEC